MGQISIARVVDLLNAGGVRAEAAYPAELITRIIVPVAAVSLAEACPAKGDYRMLVEVLGPKESGGQACQQKALEVCKILEANGAVCKQGGCSFLSKGNVFCVKVEAQFSTAEVFTVVAGDVPLPYACGFSSSQKAIKEEETLRDVPWEVTVEEFFPWGVQDTLGIKEPFQLEFCCAQKIERYEGCVWIERKRVAEQNGIRQVRKAKSLNRIYTSK